MATKDFSNVQEKQIAEYLGWKVVSGSGARCFHPGDVECDEWLGECKTHTSLQSDIKFNKSFWDKISEEASSKFKYPVLFVDNGSLNIGDTWALFNYDLVRPIQSHCIKSKNIRVRTNIIFDHIDVKSEYYDMLGVCKSDTIPVILLNIWGQSLGILPLFKFLCMIRGD